MNPIWAIPLLAGATAGTIVLGLLSKFIDRKVTAWVQWRKGPPWYQPAVDIIKLLGKETVVPEGARMTGFLLAPLLGFAAVSVAATLLWWVHLNPAAEAGFAGDVIVVLYLLTIPSLAIIIGGSASGNPLAAVGAGREMKLIIAYELPMLLAILAAIAGSSQNFQLGSLIGISTSGVLATIGCVLGFIVVLMCIQAKLGLVPFDIAEAGCEIASGPFIEYSGAPLAILFLTKAMLFAVMPIFAVTVFWGGFSFSSVGAAAASIGKYVLVLVVLTLVRNTNPRVRIDHAMKFFWFIMTPLAVLALILSMC